VKIGDFSHASLASELMLHELDFRLSTPDDVIRLTDCAEIGRKHWKSLPHEAYEVVFLTELRSVASDVWSLGTVMWEIFADGAVAFEGLDDTTVQSMVSCFFCCPSLLTLADDWGRSARSAAQHVSATRAPADDAVLDIDYVGAHHPRERGVGAVVHDRDRPGTASIAQRDSPIPIARELCACC
jgi:serine/threonine protein kinase